tara:strand:+ start:1891 stop:2682 length:792 start_codon:yes stop_codon:yes gene_type:complete
MENSDNVIQETGSQDELPYESQSQSQSDPPSESQSTSTPAQSDMKTPVSGFVTMGIFMFFNLILLLITIGKSSNPNNPTFAFNEMLKQSTLLYLIAQTFGLVMMSSIFPSVSKNSHLLVPIILGLTAYILTLTMGYIQLSECSGSGVQSIVREKEGTTTESETKRTVGGKKKLLVWMLSILPAFAVVLVVLGCYAFDFMKSPFYDLLGGGESSWGLYMAIGFWSACAIWPTVSIVYYTMMRFSCKDDQSITLKDMSEVLENDD